MAATPDDVPEEYTTVGTDANDVDSYEHVTLENGDVIVYDAENEDAWIQSASAIGLAFVR